MQGLNNLVAIYQLTYLLVPFTLACIATVSTPSPEDTTTTVSSETTTTTTNDCADCTIDSVTFEQPDGTADRIATSGQVTTDAATGCLTLTATCTADAGMIAFMEFNINQGGPVENAGMTQTVSAPLNCRGGVWYYQDVRAITSVRCQQASQ
ncbi:hypothetical protein WR25_03288 [Diploscapter pachys]|uniref:C6 domain-containing protein n=1 Tax=Diploscapter pachys TaxID=2018661 RepID=A0A2A2JQD7_9BILA|nr:hypothetical protein WR25_03288 [Diploscapter pachys]